MARSRFGRSLAASLALWAGSASATHITDRLAVGLYDQPNDTEPRQILTSGTPLEILERGERLCRVQLVDGTQGWLECQYLTTEKPARALLLESQAQNGQLRRQIEDLEATVKQRDVRIAELGTRLRAADNLLAAKNTAPAPAPVQAPTPAPAPIPAPACPAPVVPEPAPAQGALTAVPPATLTGRLLAAAQDPITWITSAGALVVGWSAGLLLRPRRRHPPPLFLR